MKTERSNVHMTSNVYPVEVIDDHIDFRTTPHFTAQLADREALRKLIQMRYGRVNDRRHTVQYAESMPGLQEWQVSRIEGCDSCSCAEPGDKPWGTKIVNGKHTPVCRCERSHCEHFEECRPDKGRRHVNQ